MLGTVVHMYQRGNICLPVHLLFSLQSAKHLQKSGVESLALAIPHGVVRGGASLLYPTQDTQLLDDFALKISTLVTVHPGWKSVMHNEIVVYNLSSHLGSLVPGGMSLRILREVVRHYQNVFKATLGCLNCQVVPTDKFHRLSGENILQWSHLVDWALSSHTPGTISNMFFHIWCHPWPETPGA